MSGWQPSGLSGGTPRGPAPGPVPAPLHEVQVAPGLEAVARAEIRARLGRRVVLLAGTGGDEPGSLRLALDGEPRALLALRTAHAVWLVGIFPVPRPRALLGDAHLRRLLGMIRDVVALHPPGAFTTLHLSAAGAETPVMTRLTSELAGATGLGLADGPGDLVVRLRRARGAAEGWEALVRLTPRPLATRTWRVCNRDGALNAAVAAAMVALGRPRATDEVLNVGCGSGTLMIERALAAPAARVLGCDTDPAALACARANIEAAGCGATTALHAWDATALPLPEASVDVVLADLPFGHLVGSHAENEALYPALLAEAGRVTRPGGRAVLITQEVRLLERCLGRQAAWRSLACHRLTLERLQPGIFVLEREAGEPSAAGGRPRRG